MFLPCRARGIVQPVIFNELDKRSGITISLGGFKISSNQAGDSTARVTRGLSARKLYFECTFGTVGTDTHAVGMSAAGIATNRFIGQDSTSWGYWSGGSTYNNNAATSGAGTWSGTNVIGVAVDLGAGKIWWAKNNVWIASGDPAAGTNARYSNLSGTLFPAVTHEAAASQQTTINLGLTAFTYTPPSGFVGWQQGTR